MGRGAPHHQRSRRMDEHSTAHDQAAGDEDEEEAPVPKAKNVPVPLDAVAIGAALIARSIASCPGNCACPYHEDRAGRSCGRRSAHSRGGGRAPLCFPDDITPAMIANYRQSRR